MTSVIIYHNISEQGGDTDITAKGFEAHMSALRSAGYTGVSVEDIRAFVERGKPLPEKSVLALSGDDEEEYLALLRADIERSLSDIEAGTGVPPAAPAYPHGDWDIRAQAVINTFDLPVTFGANYGSNTLIKGLPQSLLALNRIVMSDGVSPQSLISQLETLTEK